MLNKASYHEDSGELEAQCHVIDGGKGHNHV